MQILITSISNFALLLTISLCHFQSTFANHFKSSSSFAQVAHVTKPNCPTKCGNLTVPYPFGFGMDPTCSINLFFHLNCDASVDPPKAFLGSDKLVVLGIYDSEIIIKNRLASVCYDGDNQNSTPFVDFSMNLSDTPFAFSNKNKLTVVGCDDVSIMSSGSSEWDGSVSSCVAICSKTQDLVDGSCSGIGCCQSSIPKGLKSVRSSMTTLDLHHKVYSFNPCGYSFLAGPNSYKFQTSDVSDPSFVERTVENVALVVDWAIGDQTCDQIQRRNKTICEGESVCVDSDTGLRGYRCNCSYGYQGNPYLSPGCQDINECEFNPCHAKAICINIPGSFNCSCPPNYLGDGIKNGTGCIYLPPPSKTALYAGLPAGLGLFVVLAVRIAAEIANAVAYLHYATSIPIYHRDMKSNNILLDEKYRAKLSDFGISRSVGIDETHLTTKVKGTFGYLDPEYFQTSKFTEKSDVYSFGVILVELLTGLKPISTSETEEERSLVTRFLLTMKENRLRTILDSRITEQGASEEHIAVADLAKRCLNLSGKKRPTIREVAVELESIRACGNPSFVESNIENISCTETDSFVISGTEFWLWSKKTNEMTVSVVTCS